MAYKVTSRRSYGSRIMNSFVGVLLGIALIIGMSILLFWNEGRYNLADLAKNAQELTATNASSLEGQLVWHKCTLQGGTMTFLNDDVIIDNNYIYLERNVEVYAWIESSETKTHDNIGGSQDVETVYSYKLGWTDNPVDPVNFQDPEMHTKQAPIVNIASMQYRNPNITIDKYSIDADTLEISSIQELILKSGETVEAGALSEEALISGNYIYYKAPLSTGPNNPSFNDIRVKYQYIPASLDGLIIGKIKGNSLVKFINEDAEIYRFFDANTLEEAVSQLNQEYKTTTWMLRIIGSIAMCVGFALLTGPFSTLLMVLPMLGNASKFLLGIVSFLIGAVYSVIVIVISAVFHNPIALAVAIGIIILLVIMGIRKKKKKVKA